MQSDSEGKKLNEHISLIDMTSHHNTTDISADRTDMSVTTDWLEQNKPTSQTENR